MRLLRAHLPPLLVRGATPLESNPGGPDIFLPLAPENLALTVNEGGTEVLGAATLRGTYPDMIWYDVSSTSRTALTISPPPATLEGDRMIAILMWRLPDTDITPPAGWEPVEGAVDVPGGTFGDQDFHVYQKIAGPSEPATQDFTAPTATRCSAVVFALEGSNNGVVDVLASPENGGSCDIPTVADRLNICAFTWVYALESGEGAGQSWASGDPLWDHIPIFFESNGRRLHAAWGNRADTMRLTHTSATTSNSPNAASLRLLVAEFGETSLASHCFAWDYNGDAQTPALDFHLEVSEDDGQTWTPVEEGDFPANEPARSGCIDAPEPANPVTDASGELRVWIAAGESPVFLRDGLTSGDVPPSGNQRTPAGLVDGDDIFSIQNLAPGYEAMHFVTDNWGANNACTYHEDWNGGPAFDLVQHVRMKLSPNAGQGNENFGSVSNEAEEAKTLFFVGGIGSDPSPEARRWAFSTMTSSNQRGCVIQVGNRSSTDYLAGVNDVAYDLIGQPADAITAESVYLIVARMTDSGDSGGELTLWLDGQLVQTISISPGNVNLYNPGFWIGGYYATGANLMFKEAIGYLGALPDEEVEAIMAHLMAKHGITS